MEKNTGEIAIKIEGVKKRYKLGQIGGATLRGDIQSRWAKVRGKEDPNTKIGQQQRLVGQSFMALNGIDLTVYKGEALGIIGGNGAGKSTLLKLLSRVTAPTEGTIDLYGRVTSMLEVGTGFNGEMTGRENIYLNGAILGMTKAEIDSKMEQIIEFSEVRDFIDTPVKRYSSGMYVKLAFSVAAHLDSEIMIMDEVLAVGDMAFQKKCLDKMRDAAKKEGRTVLYVSHNMNTIRKLCDRCVVLERGEVIYSGDTDSAISVYMGSKVDVVQKKEFSQDDHEKWCLQGMYVNSLRIKNNVFSTVIGDLINFGVDYRAEMDIQNLRARLVVLNSDGEKIGMAISRDTFCLRKGKTDTLDFNFDTSILSAGRYTTRFSVFNLSEYGGHEYCCVINDFFSFELQDNPTLNYGMQWDIRSCGNIAFPPLEIDRK